MDCLKPGDIAIFATPLAFRWVHFTYAIEKGLNVFMEKPLTADGPTSRKMFKLAEEATAKNLKVGVGLMSRHSRAMQELAERIHDGEIGDLILLRGYRMHGPLGSIPLGAEAGRHARGGLPDPALPQLSLGQRRLLQRLLHPHHRPLLLDEERLAGPGPGPGRPPLSRRLRRPELRHLLRGIHVRRRNQVHHGRPLHRRAARRSTTASRTAPRARRSSPTAATAEGLPPRSRAWARRGRTGSGNPKA